VKSMDSQVIRRSFSWQNAIAEGFRHLGFKDDHELIAAESIVYDALYGYCQEMVRRGKPDGQYR
jgi:hypothetical protein